MFLLIHEAISIVENAGLTLHSTMFLLIRCSWFPWLHSAGSFTFHYVSINTHDRAQQKTFPFIFTFHYVSINTIVGGVESGGQVYFTFHYVSINTKTGTLRFNQDAALHSTMFLLILRFCLRLEPLIYTLHSTMFLLILDRGLSMVSALWLYIPLCFY